MRRPFPPWIMLVRYYSEFWGFGSALCMQIRCESVVVMCVMVLVLVTGRVAVQRRGCGSPLGGGCAASRDVSAPRAIYYP